jgi:predicted amidohydrolase YtcJ
MLNLSVDVVFGSDFPVEPVNPLIGFYSAVTRMVPHTHPHTHTRTDHSFPLGRTRAIQV